MKNGKRLRTGGPIKPLVLAGDKAAGSSAARGDGLIGESAAMKELFGMIDRLAQSRVRVLIQGESGTGKELVARALHRGGPRRCGAFVALNTAAIPPQLAESELFGHPHGSISGTEHGRTGRILQADGGTLFLDEVGDMPLDLQARLLRVLEDGEIYPVGATLPVKVDVRVIAATHHDLGKLVAWGRFREDLYHRLNAVSIRLPPLRARREDIPALLRHFLESAAAELNCEPPLLLPEAEAFLASLDWPGNVRELDNACRRICLAGGPSTVGLDDLPPELLALRSQAAVSAASWQTPFRRWVDQRLRQGEDNVAWEAIKAAEGILIATALELTEGCKQDAARLLGYGRNTLSRKLAELDLAEGTEELAAGPSGSRGD